MLEEIVRPILKRMKKWWAWPDLTIRAANIFLKQVQVREQAYNKTHFNRSIVINGGPGRT